MWWRSMSLIEQKIAFSKFSENFNFCFEAFSLSSSHIERLWKLTCDKENKDQ